MKTTTTPLSGEFDEEGFPVPEPLPEEIMDPDGRLEDAVVRQRSAERAGGSDHNDRDGREAQIAPELFKPPAGWAGASAPPDLGLSTADPDYVPPRVSGVFAPPAPLFGPAAAPLFGPAAEPLLGRDLIAPDAPPIGVDDATLAAHGANPDDPFGTRPLVASVPEADDDSSTPMWMRDVRLGHSICRRCKHGWERLHAMPATSRSRVFFQYAINCTAFGKEPYDVTSATVFSCSRFKSSKKRIVKPVQVMVEEARARVRAGTDDADE